jgi:hypothetical protein
LEKSRHVIKLEDIPGPLRDIFSVILLRGLIVDGDTKGNLYFHDVTYSWFVDPNDLHVVRDLDGFGTNVDRADTLQKALRLALKDYTNLLKHLPKKRIIMVE